MVVSALSVFYFHDFVGVHSVHSENVRQKDSKHLCKKKKINFEIKKRTSVEFRSIEVYMTVISQFWSKVFKICRIPLFTGVVCLGCIQNSHIFSLEGQERLMGSYLSEVVLHTGTRENCL